MRNSNGSAMAEGLFFGAIFGLTIGAFLRLLKMTVGIPATIISVYRDPSLRPHFLYYPAAALTIVALVMVFIVGATGHPMIILYGLFVGWIAGDIKYYSQRWCESGQWLSWCPGAGYTRNGEIVISDYDKIYTVVLTIFTGLMVLLFVAPALQ